MAPHQIPVLREAQPRAGRWRDPGAFEAAASQEVQQAFGHLHLLCPKREMNPARSPGLAIEGETYEYSEISPKFRHLAVQGQNGAAVQKFDEPIADPMEHAEQSKAVPEKAAKRFSALARV